MPTIIDSLIVTLGINASNLNAQSVSSINRLRQIEQQADKTEKSFTDLSKSFAGFLALFGGVVAIRRFVEDTINANAALDRFSRNIGVNVQTVSAWGKAVEELGGSAKGLQGTFDMLSKAQTELRLTGQSSLIPYFSSLGVAIAGVGGQARPVQDILLDLSDRFAGMDRTTANNIGRMMGLDQDTLNLLLQGRQEVELMVDRQKQLNAVTKAQAEQASKQQRSLVDLRQRWENFGRKLLDTVAPALDKILDLLTKVGDWVNENSDTVKTFLTIMAVGLGAIGIAAIPINATVLAITALAAAIALLYNDYQVWKRGGDSFIDWEKWKPGIDLATAAIDKLQGRIKSFWNDFKAMRDDPHTRWDTLEMFGLYKKRPPAPGKEVSETGDSNRIRKYFTDRGWSPEQAAGIAANLISESNGKTNATGDSGTAYGVAQWHKDRQDKFRDFAGKDIRNSSLDEQLAFVNFELTKGNEQSAGKALKGATSAADAGSIVSRMYERPKDTEGEASRRATLAATISGIRGASAPLEMAGAGAGGAGTTIDRSVTTHIDKIEVVTQATDADGIARGMGNSMDFLFTSQANRGLD